MFDNAQKAKRAFLSIQNSQTSLTCLDKVGVGYQFKFSLAIVNLGMSSVIKGDDKKLEIWIIGQSDVYSLGAKTRKAKEDFAVELRNVIIKQVRTQIFCKPHQIFCEHKYRIDNIQNIFLQKERNANRPVRISQSIVYNEQMSTTSGVSSESLR